MEKSLNVPLTVLSKKFSMGYMYSGGWDIFLKECRTTVTRTVTGQGKSHHFINRVPQCSVDGNICANLVRFPIVYSERS